jgi:predicted dehydrogenase
MDTKIVIVGSGFGMYCLLPTFSKIKGCKVVGICGKDSERMTNYCKKFGVSRYTNWKEMLEKEKPDAIAIAIIPKYQYEIAKYSLENNIAVFAEKPLTTSFTDSLILKELAKTKKLPNMIDFEFPEIPEWRKAKQILENEQIGKVFSISVNWTFLSYDLKNKIDSWKTDIEQGGGALSLVFSHTFYYLEYFLGEIKDLQCNFSSSEKSLNNGETTINMTISFKNGCKGNIHVDISDSEQQKHVIEFHGTNGKLILQNQSNSLVDNFELILHTTNGPQKIESDKPVIISNENSEDPRVKVVSYLAEKFIKWCNTGISVKPDFQDGARVQELIDMARSSNSKSQN